MCVLSTYCSPAFWLQSRSEGSVGSAGPRGEEVEEPQTLEQQHPEGKQQEQQRNREWHEIMDRKERQSKKRIKDNMKGEKIQKQKGEKHVSEQNSAGSTAEQHHFHGANQWSLVLQHFQAGLKRNSSHHLIRARESTSSASALSQKQTLKAAIHFWSWWKCHKVQTQKQDSGKVTVQQHLESFEVWMRSEF